MKSHPIVSLTLSPYLHYRHPALWLRFDLFLQNERLRVPQVFKLVFQDKLGCLEVKECVIQFKILHRLHYSEEKLHKIFLEVSPLGERCNLLHKL